MEITRIGLISVNTIISIVILTCIFGAAAIQAFKQLRLREFLEVIIVIIILIVLAIVSSLYVVIY